MCNLKVYCPSSFGSTPWCKELMNSSARTAWDVPFLRERVTEWGFNGTLAQRWLCSARSNFLNAYWTLSYFLICYSRCLQFQGPRFLPSHRHSLLSVRVHIKWTSRRLCHTASRLFEKQFQWCHSTDNRWVSNIPLYQSFQGELTSKSRCGLKSELGWVDEWLRVDY